MNKKALVNKVMQILEATEMSVSSLNRLVESIRKMKNTHDIYMTILRTLNSYSFSKNQLKDIFNKLMSKEKIQKISPAHDHAMKKILHDFGGDYHSFK